MGTRFGGASVLIIPLGHERSVARRWPWITTLIIALNVCVFLAFLSPDRRVNGQLEQLVTQAVTHYTEHPGLTLRSPLREWLPQLVAEAEQAEAAEPDPEAQAELDEYMLEIDRVRQQLSAWRYGYEPTRAGWSGLLTHQFLHGGWLHLLFNLWFLWLVGCNVEDAWGRVLFPLFYLSGGAFAGLLHGWMSAPDGLVLIGASGAVAAAMGAFLVGFARTKIRFVGMLLFRPMAFSAPAYVMLPLWAGVELVWGLTQAGSGVAHWAHVGGFGYGFAVALAVRLSGTDQRIEQQIEQDEEQFVVDPELLRASAAIDAGNAGSVIEVLERRSAQRNASALVFCELVRARQAVGDVEAARQGKLRLLEWYLQKQSVEEALGVFEELRNEQASQLVAPVLRLRLARQYRRRGDAERAALAFEELHSSAERSEHSLPALLAHAELLLDLEQLPAAHRLYERARSFVSTDVQVEAAIRQGLARTSAAQRPSTAPPPA
jgi:membrane associated rhomboid family serine protease